MFFFSEAIKFDCCGYVPALRIAKFLVLSVRCLYQFVSPTLPKYGRCSVCIGFNSLTNEHSPSITKSELDVFCYKFHILVYRVSGGRGIKAVRRKTSRTSLRVAAKPARTIGLPLHHICKHALRLGLPTFFFNSL